ncbi:hypothetical protein GJV85_03590 [Sulfurimonas aquatica]|uniref:Carrier domain-containing protein n=1 Tax=Sulfurimonas aquatica TaxID=2672570 RepID=A0A975AZ75_9BACT|nr:acyl carrier protein [Sulfurimonas aquatica]QSZ41233.1 hypothetical protein GJV85_03590 [Sulfurimonas aquatica]
MNSDLILNKIIQEVSLLSKKDVINYNQEIFGKDGLLDSLNVLHIMLFIEREFNIQINPENVTLDNFGTINKIYDLIKLYE